MSAPAPTYRNIASQLVDVQDKLTTVRSLHEAIFMSAFAICTSAQRNAIQTVVNLAEEKLQEIAEEVAGLRSQNEDEDQDELVAAILRYQQLRPSLTRSRMTYWKVTAWREKTHLWLPLMGLHWKRLKTGQRRQTRWLVLSRRFASGWKRRKLTAGHQTLSRR